jgi:hypothetical protein
MMTDQEKARRLAELQRQSQFFDPSNPMMLVPPSGDREPDDVSLAGPDGVSEEAPPKAPMRIPSDDEIKSRMAKQAQDARTNTLRTIPMAGAKAAARQQQRRKDFGAMSGGAPSTPDPAAPSLLSLSPAAQDNLRQKYESSGHTQTMPFEEWYQDNFTGSFPHQIESAANSTVRIQPGKDPRLEPGQNSAVAKSRLAAGKPLPEGRDASQYSDKQRRTMQRNVHSPEVPMSQFGGTFTHNVDGSVSSRAPNPQMLQTAAEIAADPEQGPGSASHTMALAMAYGIDATQYGDDMDLLKADVARENKRHQQLQSGGWEVSEDPSPMGGYTYKYNPQEAQKSLATREQAMSPRRKAQFANEIVARHEGLLTPEERASVETMIETPNGFTQLRALNDRLNRRSLGLRNQNVRNNWASRNMTIAANNPMVAQGLYMRSLQEAARSGDPMQVAAVHSSFGNDRAARDYMSLAGQQAEAAAVAVAGESAARAKDKDTPTSKMLAEQFDEQVSAAMRNPDPVARRTILVGILTKMEVVPPDQVEKVADALIMSASGGAVAPEQTRTWWQWLTGTPQTPAAPQQPQPLPAGVSGPALPPQQAATPSTAPPASGRGAMADRVDTAIRDFFSGNGPRLPDKNHPYRRGS